MRRDGDDELSAGLEPRGNRSERRPIVVDMLDHVERADQIVVTVANPGELGKRSAHHFAPEPFFRKPPSLLVELERVDFAELTEHREVVTGAAADLENPRVSRRTN